MFKVLDLALGIQRSRGMVFIFGMLGGTLALFTGKT